MKISEFTVSVATCAYSSGHATISFFSVERAEGNVVPRSFCLTEQSEVVL
ncbi:hypothetical protein AN958_12666 [Leucoagaricus sp. SymC.cos]|nr:hypothetical protein AN958_12666 [Leucoagaricus sp. SymC.cos]